MGALWEVRNAGTSIRQYHSLAEAEATQQVDEKGEKITPDVTCSAAL